MAGPQIDWLDQRREDAWEFQMLSPSNTAQTYGNLRDVDLKSTSLTWDYYKDTRCSGKLRYYGDGWVRNSFIRVVHKVPKAGYSRILGTYIVTDNDAEREDGRWHTDLTLNSTLYGLSTEKAYAPWTLAQNSSTVLAMERILDSSRRIYRNGNARDFRLKQNLVLESGVSQLERLYKLADMGKDRLDVDPLGVVTIDTYVEPGKRAKTFTIDLTSKRGIAHDGLSRKSDYLRVPSIVVVSCKYTDTNQKRKKGEKAQQSEINAYVNASGQWNASNRGYQVTDFHSESDMDPKTYAHALELAKGYLAKDLHEDLEWELTTQYLPITEGDAGWLVLPDGVGGYSGRRSVFVKQMDLSLDEMSMKLTLKETSARDEEKGF
jgi:hypothetical protein